jgi:hypothetical protein
MLVSRGRIKTRQVRNSLGKNSLPLLFAKYYIRVKKGDFVAENTAFSQVESLGWRTDGRSKYFNS